MTWNRQCFRSMYAQISMGSGLSDAILILDYVGTEETRSYQNGISGYDFVEKSLWCFISRWNRLSETRNPFDRYALRSYIKRPFWTHQQHIRTFSFAPFDFFNMKIQISTVTTFLVLMRFTSGLRFWSRDDGCGDLHLCKVFFCCDDNGTIGTSLKVRC